MRVSPPEVLKRSSALRSPIAASPMKWSIFTGRPCGIEMATCKSPESDDDQFHMSSHQSLSMPSIATTSASPDVERRTF